MVTIPCIVYGIPGPRQSKNRLAPGAGPRALSLMAIIQDIDKGGGEIIRVEITEFKGRRYLNLRIWYTDKNTGEFKPTQKGIAVKPELFAELKEAVLRAEPEMAQLLNEAGGDPAANVAPPADQ